MNLKMFTEDEQAIFRLMRSQFKWIARDANGKLYVYEGKPKRDGLEFVCSKPKTEFAGMEIFEHIFKGVTFENSPIRFRGETLDKVERRYLKSVFSPFRKTIVFVEKKCDESGLQRIEATLACGDVISFPRFDPRVMYKGMMVGEKYSLEDLGIKYCPFCGEELNNETQRDGRQ